MSRLSMILALLVVVLGAALAWVVTRPVPVGLSEAEVRALVAETVAARQDTPSDAPAPLDAAAINAMIERYLLDNPRILQRVSEALDSELRTAQAEESKAAIAAMHAEIYEDPDHVVLGNPEGDVTLVEMFDYNCGYCRQALPDLATLLAEDPNLKVILKEFPILSQESADAARVSVLVGRSDADYWDFHRRLFTSRGQITGETALQTAQEMGLNRINLELEMGTPEVGAVIERSYQLAAALNISGTPTYIIGDELIPGAVGIDGLRTRIANMRSCGKTVCEPVDSEG
ncbi:MAG TPA: DsbA family protein [Devosiaceae bacterium]|jgi:protein-disulfide isomerase|nr:DsbA family protein [Devosiaceae bacterium]